MWSHCHSVAYISPLSSSKVGWPYSTQTKQPVAFAVRNNQPARKEDGWAHTWFLKCILLQY